MRLVCTRTQSSFGNGAIQKKGQWMLLNRFVCFPIYSSNHSLCPLLDLLWGPFGREISGPEDNHYLLWGETVGKKLDADFPGIIGASKIVLFVRMSRNLVSVSRFTRIYLMQNLSRLWRRLAVCSHALTMSTNLYRKTPKGWQQLMIQNQGMEVKLYFLSGWPRARRGLKKKSFCTLSPPF